MRRQPVTLATSREPVAQQNKLSASWYHGIDSDRAFNCRAAVGRRESLLRPRSVLDSLPHPLTEALLSPYLGGIAPHVPALGKPILPISLPAYLDRPIFTPKSPSISTLWRLCWPVATSHPFPVPIAIHLVDAETKHPIRKDVDDMRCTPRKTAGEWSPQDGV